MFGYVWIVSKIFYSGANASFGDVVVLKPFSDIAFLLRREPTLFL